jgi:predicted nucleic acid-binding protein
MAEVVFLDTNGWIALLNACDQLHSAADTCWQELGRRGSRIIVTEWVIAEAGNGLARSRARSQFPEAVARIKGSPYAEIVRISEDRFERALALYAARPDKTWGLVDCASFEVMAEFDIVQAFTNDRHFQQAGYRCLLPIP